MNTSNTLKISRLLIACLFLLVVIVQYKIALLFQINTTSTYASLLMWSICILFFVLNLAAAYGLFFVKRWGYWLAYLAILFSTLFFSSAYIPFINQLFTSSIRYLALMIENFILFGFVVYLHVASKYLTR